MRPPGRPKGSMDYHFKSTGEGWQSRMDGVLREYVTRHSRRA